MRRAQIEIQFNWIFVLIVGVSILAFIIAFTFRHQDVAETRVSVQLAEQFETILATTAQQPGTAKEYRTPRVELEFACERGTDLHNYRINGLVAADTPYDLIVGPERKTTSTIRTWALEWQVPYPVDTFLYVTTPDDEVLFYAPGAQASGTLAAALERYPDNFTYQVIGPSSRVRQNQDTYTLVIFTDTGIPSPPLFPNLPEERTRVVIVDPDDGLRRGVLYLYDYSEYKDTVASAASLTMDSVRESDHRSYYLGAASLFAAVFSEDRDRYLCVMQQALDRLQMVSLIMSYEIDTITQGSLSPSCRDLVVGSCEDSIHYGIRCYLDEINTSSSQPFNDAAETIGSHMQRIDGLHDKIAVENRCPLLY